VGGIERAKRRGARPFAGFGSVVVRRNAGVIFAVAEAVAFTVATMRLAVAVVAGGLGVGRRTGIAGGRMTAVTATTTMTATTAIAATTAVAATTTIAATAAATATATATATAAAAAFGMSIAESWEQEIGIETDWCEEASYG
jgi:hypothetical protein